MQVPQPPCHLLMPWSAPANMVVTTPATKQRHSGRGQGDASTWGNPAGTGHCGRWPVGKTQTPSLHSPERWAARARTTARLFSLHLTARPPARWRRVRHLCSRRGLHPLGHGAGRRGRLDLSRCGAAGEAGGLSTNSQPDPLFPPSAPRRCLCRRPELAARTARSSWGCGHQHRRRLRQKEPERRQPPPPAPPAGGRRRPRQECGQRCPPGRRAGGRWGSAIGGTAPPAPLRSAPLGQTPTRSPPGPTHTVPPWWTCCRPALPLGAAERRPPAATELPVAVPVPPPVPQGCGPGSGGRAGPGGSALKGAARLAAAANTASAGTGCETGRGTWDLGRDAERKAGWRRGGPGAPAPAALWPRRGCHNVELGAAEPEDLDKRRRCPRGPPGWPGLRKDWRCPRPAPRAVPRELHWARTALVALPGAVLGIRVIPDVEQHCCSLASFSPSPLGSSCTAGGRAGGASGPAFPTSFGRAPSAWDRPAFPEETRAALSPHCVPLLLQIPATVTAPGPRWVEKIFVRLWWEYSINNKSHLLQEKLFHCCASYQLPHRPDLTVPGVRN